MQNILKITSYVTLGTQAFTDHGNYGSVLVHVCTFVPCKSLLLLSLGLELREDLLKQFSVLEIFRTVQQNRSYVCVCVSQYVCGWMGGHVHVCVCV